MGRQQFNPTDKPSFNLFDLPTICDDSSPGTKPCCGPCTDWIFCLLRTPLELTLPGLDFSRWLPTVSMSGSKILQSSGVFSAIFSGDTDDPENGNNEFSGRYLVLPDSDHLLANNEDVCPRRAIDERCLTTYGFGYGAWPGGNLYGWYGWWWGYQFEDPEGWELGYEYYGWYDTWWDYYGYGWQATHHMTVGRTVIAPAAVDGTIKNFYIDCAVTCEYNELDELCLRFTALLRFAWEKPDDVYCLGCMSLSYGVPVCDPGIVNVLENEEGWGTNADEFEYCVPLMRTALIPMAGLTWADLQTGYEFEVIPPPTWELVTPDPPYVSYWRVTGGSYGGAALPELGMILQVSWGTGYGSVELGCEGEDPENAACDTVEDGVAETSEHYGVHETGNICPEDGPWLPSGCGWGGSALYYRHTKICVPKPITVNEGLKWVKAVAPSCFAPSGCGSCTPDPEVPHVKVPANFDISYDAGTSCYKQFRPVIADCVTILKVFWSWGGVSEGLEPIYHKILNVGPDGVEREERITAIALADNGCLYCTSATITCGCCDGVSGSISVEVNAESTCQVTITAHVTATEECPHPRIELIRSGGGGCAEFESLVNDCTCQQMFEGAEADPPCEIYDSCTFSLGDGSSHTFTIDDPPETLRWRVVDGPCGCASDWFEQAMVCTWCECCSTPLTGALLIFSGTGQGDLPGCLDCDIKIDGAYYVPLQECGNTKSFVGHFLCEGEGAGPETVTIGIFITCYPGIGPDGEDVVFIDAFIDAPSLSQVDFQKILFFPPGSFPMDCAAELDGFIPNLYFGGSPWLAPCSGSGMSLEVQFLS
jgi:hypothetical protein